MIRSLVDSEMGIRGSPRRTQRALCARHPAHHDLGVPTSCSARNASQRFGASRVPYRQRTSLAQYPRAVSSGGSRVKTVLSR